MTHRFGITIKTQLTYDELENVIGQYCRGGYSISLGGIDDSRNGRRKIMLVWFEQTEDRDRLRAIFAVRSGKASGMPGHRSPKGDTAFA